MLEIYQQSVNVIVRSLNDYGVYIVVAFIIFYKLTSRQKERNIPRFENGKLTIIDSDKASVWYSTIFGIIFLSFMVRWNLNIYQQGKSNDLMIYHVISGIILLFAITKIIRRFHRTSIVTCSIDRNSRTIILREAGSEIHKDLSYSFDEVDSFDCETKVVRSSSGSSSSSTTRYRLNLILKTGETIHLRETFGSVQWERWYKAVRDFDGDGRIDHKDITYTDNIQDNIKSETITFSGKQSKTRSIAGGGPSPAHWITRQKKSDGQFVLLIYQSTRKPGPKKKKMGGFKILLSRLFFATLGRMFLKLYLVSNFIQTSDVNHLKGIIFKPEILQILLPHFAVLTDSESTTRRLLGDWTQKELVKLAEFARSQDLSTLLVLFNGEGLRLVHSKSNDTKIQEEIGLAGAKIAKTIR